MATREHENIPYLDNLCFLNHEVLHNNRQTDPTQFNEYQVCSPYDLIFIYFPM